MKSLLKLFFVLFFSESPAMANSSKQLATAVQNLKYLTCLAFFASGDAIKSHQIKILGAQTQSNIELEEKADEDELDIKDLNIRLL